MDKMTENYFEDIVNDYYNEIFHYIRKQTNHLEDAKDLTQEVFMKVHKNLKSYNPQKASIRTWIYRISHNHVMNYFKKAYKRHEVSVDDMFIDYFNSSEDILEQFIQIDDSMMIVKTMERILNSKHFKIMNLYFFSELSKEDISISLNIPVKTIYNTINVSIKKIKKELEGFIDG